MNKESQELPGGINTVTRPVECGSNLSPKLHGETPRCLQDGALILSADAEGEQLFQPVEDMVVVVGHLETACQGLQEGVVLTIVDRNSSERHSDWT